MIPYFPNRFKERGEKEGNKEKRGGIEF